MNAPIQKLTVFFIALLLSKTIAAQSFSLSSTDIKQGEFLDTKHVFQGFGCQGENQSPHLTWSNVPKGTKTFAVLAYDPDAPTGSGWWHWQLINIPNTISELPSNTGNISASLTPQGSTQLNNDYGSTGFGGACPPKGHGVHRYQFTVHALSTKLELPDNASSALVGYMVHANSLGSASIEALYKR